MGNVSVQLKQSLSMSVIPNPRDRELGLDELISLIKLDFDAGWELIENKD